MCMLQVDVLDVLIVGAGPTGLALATQLHRFGVRIRLIDRLRDRARESRALAVQARSLELLQMVQLGEPLVARGLATSGLKLHVEGRAVAEVRLGDGAIGAGDTRFPFILLVSQTETEAILADHLQSAGLTIERGAELAAFDASVDHVRCLIRHDDGRQEEVRARFLAGCDGAHSTVRKGAGIRFEGGSYPQDFMLGDVEADVLPSAGPVRRDVLQSGTINAFIGGGGVAMFFPIGRPTTWRVIAMASEPDGASGAGDGSDRERQDQPMATASDLGLADLQAMVNAPTARGVRLRDPAWLTRFHLHHRQTAHYRKGRVFLAGDAAHIHSPVGGQGMNTGIQDAWNLGWKLALVARGSADPRLLDSYEAERWPVGQFLLRYTDRAFRTFTGAISNGPLAAWARRVLAPRVLPHIVASPRLRRALFAFVSELAVRYRRSAAVAEGEPRQVGGPRAGDRLPDARVLRHGRAVWLQEAIAGPHLSLLLCGDLRMWDGRRLTQLGERYRDVVRIYGVSQVAPDALPVTTRVDSLVDDQGEGFTRLGVQDARQYLVRPDGYIGFRCSGHRFDSLERYLETWFAGGNKL